MWKRLLVVTMALVGIFSVAYVYANHNLDDALEATSAYRSGGNITGRIGPAGIKPDGTAGAMVKGDQIAFQSTTSKGTPITWYLIANGLSNANNPGKVNLDATARYGYTLSATSPTTHGTHVWHALSGLLDSTSYTEAGTTYVRRPNLISDQIDKIVSNISQNSLENGLIHERLVFNYIVISDTNGFTRGENRVDYLQNKVFEFNAFYEAAQDSFNGLYTKGSLNLPQSDIALPTCSNNKYWSGAINGGTSTMLNGHSMNCNTGAFNSDSLPFSSTSIPYRVGTFLDLEKVVFAVSDYLHPGISNAPYEIEAPTYNGSMANITGEAMKLRLLDNSKTIDFQDILNQNDESIYATQNIQLTGTAKVIENSILKLKANANQGNGNQMVSALVFDSSNQFIKYIPLGSANGTSAYEFNVEDMGLTKGNTYAIQLVNEEYTGENRGPVQSSALSKPFKISIVDPHKLTYTKAPQSGATKGDYEFSKNVNAGQTVGQITVNPQGIMPLTYTLDGHGDESYRNFEIAGLNNNNASSASSLNVKIKSDAQDLVNGGLKAGTYKFCISAKDANGEPKDATSNSKVCTSFVVEKTGLSVTFNNTELTKKSITEASDGWSETASATPTDGTKVTYSENGGTINLINIDSDSGEITYIGEDAYGKVEIKATADDDPATGYDNYEASETKKEIMIYREVDGYVTPESPSYQTNDSNVQQNGEIGTIKGTKGTPDNGSSGNTTYTYGLKSGDDSNFFRVDASSGKIITTANLSTAARDYHITVTVSDKWSTKEIPVTISVELAGAENLKFYENSTSNTVINTKKVNFTDTNVSVFATVKGSSNNNQVTYKLQDGSDLDVITVNANTGDITIIGTGTVTIVAEKKGASGQSPAKTTLEFTVNPGKQDFIYTTDSTLSTERPKKNGYYEPLAETYAPNKTFNVYTNGNPEGSEVTYRLSADSPTDVIKVKSDGTIEISNASKNEQMNQVIVEATSHDPNGNYEDKTIKLPINIKKGTRTITFKNNPISVANGKGKVTPVIFVDGETDPSPQSTTIEVDSAQSDIAWTTNGKEISYDWNGEEGIEIDLKATKSSDRNYEKAEVKGTLYILGADESTLTLSSPGKIIYGDTFTIQSTQDDDGSENVEYTFETNNKTFISEPEVDGNVATFHALGNSGTTMITIKVTRTADGEVTLYGSVQIKVLPKPITIQIDDKEKLRLEDNPPLTYQDFTSELAELYGVKDTVDTSHIKLTTTAKKYSPVNSYPITAGNAEKQLNDNYPNYKFTIKQGMLNVLDNGNKDFVDEDDDGCPDINIKIPDDKGNEITINGDNNEDGIPDYNIDTDGDGKPDLNIDTDNDGKPDVNLVILKDWKPTKCITLGDIQFSSGITAKAEINVDADNDLIPDINIDIDGDFKADINIDQNKNGKLEPADFNITTEIKAWKPVQNYTHQKFDYDTQKDLKPYVNVIVKGTDYPSLNLDMDLDGLPDINIDADGDGIPETNIDGDGDGKADINLDPDGTGNIESEPYEITEWNPKKKGQGDAFTFLTMEIQNQTKLEDNGVTIEKPDGSPFPPSMALKVIDVTKDQKQTIQESVKDLLEEKQEVQQVFEIKLLQNGKEIQPDGTLIIRIPIAKAYKNAILVRKNEAGEYEKIDATFENGYLVYESDILGIVSVIAETDEQDNEVQGSYYPGANMGGALTGDTTNTMTHMGIGCFSLAVLLLIIWKHQKAK